MVRRRGGPQEKPLEDAGDIQQWCLQAAKQFRLGEDQLVSLRIKLQDKLWSTPRKSLSRRTALQVTLEFIRTTKHTNG